MRLRDVGFTPADVEVYLRLRCDPVMMAELGGPLPRAGIAAKVERDARDAAADRAWIKMIIPDETRPEVVAGTVVLWTHENHGTDTGADAGRGGGADGGDAGGGGPFSEIGWMVLPAFQGRHLATLAAGALLDLARADGRWGLVHAYPAVTNGPSNGICRALGFTRHETLTVPFAGRALRANHWSIDLR
ncbi:GNAT family N-acetyltransferase [Kitasatospora sp. NPDC052896]|uniref:GNAT family N-acetyltransferase n=1 Tax=Kitasatospora sp. NPDC052896 TaxID=3364061 RepID=UPI0037C5FAAA